MKKVTRDQLCTSFSAAHPAVLRVQPGEPFVMETNDRFATYEGPPSSPEALETLTTMAGPVYIEGVQPGDTLKIEVLDVALPLDYGWIGATPGRGPLGDRIPAFRKARVRITADGRYVARFTVKQPPPALAADLAAAGFSNTPQGQVLTVTGTL